MPSVIALVSSSKLRKLRTADGAKPARGQVLQLDCDASTYGVQTLLGKGDALYLVAATRDACFEKLGVTPKDFELYLWDVIEGGRSRPRFEYWVQGAGDGTLFNYRSSRSPASIGSTQHSFESLDRDDARTARLVAQLQAAADRTTW